MKNKTLCFLTAFQFWFFTGFSCDCKPTSIDKNSIANTDYIVRVKIKDKKLAWYKDGKTKLSDDPQSGNHWVLTTEVIQNYKTINPNITLIETAASEASCGYYFEVGKEYIVFGNATHSGPYISVNMCSNTHLYDKSLEDLIVTLNKTSGITYKQINTDTGWVVCYFNQNTFLGSLKLEKGMHINAQTKSHYSDDSLVVAVVLYSEQTKHSQIILCAPKNDFTYQLSDVTQKIETRTSTSKLGQPQSFFSAFKTHINHIKKDDRGHYNIDWKVHCWDKLKKRYTVYNFTTINNGTLTDR